MIATIPTISSLLESIQKCFVVFLGDFFYHCTNMFLLESDVHPLVDEDQKTGDDTAHQNSHNHFDSYEMALFRDNHPLDTLKMYDRVTYKISIS